MRKGGGVIQNQGMRAAVVITALVVGMVFGIGFDDYKSINCELSFSSYCQGPLDSKEHNEKVAAKLKVDAKFIAAKIADTPDQRVDIAIALHACDTATDDALFWAVKNKAKVVMSAPCCMHELQTQIKDSPEPWGLLTKYGLVKERLVDLMTDSLRAQILKLLGYRVDIVEFIGGEHTARNILIRAVFTGARPSQIEITRYEELLKQWQIKPYLAKLLADELKAAAAL